MDNWHDWMKTHHPRVLRMYHVKPAYSLIGVLHNIGGGHLGSEEWHETGIGVPILNEMTGQILREIIGKREFALGHIHLDRTMAALQFMAGCPKQLQWVLTVLKTEPDCFVPVEFFYHKETGKVRARLRTTT